MQLQGYDKRMNADVGHNSINIRRKLGERRNGEREGECVCVR